MTKASSKEAVIESLSKSVLAIIDTHNFTCIPSNEVTIEELVSHLCFEYKVNDPIPKVNLSIFEGFINKTKNEEY